MSDGFLLLPRLPPTPRIEVTHDDSIISHPITTMKIGEFHNRILSSFHLAHHPRTLLSIRWIRWKFPQMKVEKAKGGNLLDFDGSFDRFFSRPPAILHHSSEHLAHDTVYVRMSVTLKRTSDSIKQYLSLSLDTHPSEYKILLIWVLLKIIEMYDVEIFAFSFFPRFDFALARCSLRFSCLWVRRIFPLPSLSKSVNMMF